MFRIALQYGATEHFGGMFMVAAASVFAVVKIAMAVVA